MKKLLVALLVLLLIPLSSNAATLQEVLNSWIGSTEQHLVESWGAPDNTYENGSIQVLSFDKTEIITINGVANALGTFGQSLCHPPYCYPQSIPQIQTWQIVRRWSFNVENESIVSDSVRTISAQRLS